MSAKHWLSFAKFALGVGVAGAGVGGTYYLVSAWSSESEKARLKLRKMSEKLPFPIVNVDGNEFVWIPLLKNGQMAVQQGADGEPMLNPQIGTVDPQTGVFKVKEPPPELATDPATGELKGVLVYAHKSNMEFARIDTPDASGIHPYKPYTLKGKKTLEDIVGDMSLRATENGHKNSVDSNNPLILKTIDNVAQTAQNKKPTPKVSDSSGDPSKDNPLSSMWVKIGGPVIGLIIAAIGNFSPTSLIVGGAAAAFGLFGDKITKLGSSDVKTDDTSKPGDPKPAGSAGPGQDASGGLPGVTVPNVPKKNSDWPQYRRASCWRKNAVIR